MMKIIVVLVLVGAALAFPVAENNEKTDLPLVITDYYSVVEEQQLTVQDSNESTSSQSQESAEVSVSESQVTTQEQQPSISLSFIDNSGENQDHNGKQQESSTNKHGKTEQSETAVPTSNLSDPLSTINSMANKNKAEYESVTQKTVFEVAGTLNATENTQLLIEEKLSLPAKAEEAQKEPPNATATERPNEENKKKISIAETYFQTNGKYKFDETQQLNLEEKLSKQYQQPQGQQLLKQLPQQNQQPFQKQQLEKLHEQLIKQHPQNQQAYIQQLQESQEFKKFQSLEQPLGSQEQQPKQIQEQSQSVTVTDIHKQLENPASSEEEPQQSTAETSTASKLVKKEQLPNSKAAKP